MSKTRKLISEFIGIIQLGADISTNEAKTIIYWCVASLGASKDAHGDHTGFFHHFPILTVYGRIETGKSTLLAVIKAITNAQEIAKTSKTEFRDLLEDYNVVIIEEGEPPESEERAHMEMRLHNRVMYNTSVVNRKEPNPPYRKVRKSVFGATAIHRRNAYDDAALTSRSIFVITRPNPHREYKKVKIETMHRFVADLGKPYADARKLWNEVVKDKPEFDGSGRGAENWWPMRLVAEKCGDTEWLAYATIEEARAMEGAIVDADYESENVVAHCIEICFSPEVVPVRPIEYILVADVATSCKEAYGQTYTHQAIRRIADVHGYHTQKGNRGVQIFRKAPDQSDENKIIAEMVDMETRVHS